ncbi:FAD-binding oxidoreductase, partial [bacterium]
MTLMPALKRRLQSIVGEDGIFDDRMHRRVYEADAYAFDSGMPDAVVLPRNADEVQRVVRSCRDSGVSFVPRGSGTGLSAGCVAGPGIIQIGLARMRRILSVDPLARIAVVEAGVINQELSDEVARHGLEFAPDPSSQIACTVGGNFAENAGGPHTLKYGVTLPHVVAARMVSAEGEMVEFRATSAGTPGPDLLALHCGAEGTTGLAVELTLCLTPIPAARRTFLALFATLSDAAGAVRGVVRTGVVPAAMEMVDRIMLDAVQEAFGYTVSRQAAAVLILELDGEADTVEREAAVVERACQEAGAIGLEHAHDEADRARLWRARKHAFGAIGRLAPDYATQDGVVPRAAVPAIVQTIEETAREFGLGIGTVLHAGDGNIHPAILYDGRDEEQVERALAAGRRILDRCIELGGSPTGEHGVGLEKRDFMPMVFCPDELDLMAELRYALDPYGMSNPGKILPA